MSNLYATICSVDDRGVLVPFGDPHVFVLDNERWRFNGRSIRYPAFSAGPVAHAGLWQVVMAVGYAPYAHEVGVVALGTFQLVKGAYLSVTPSIDIRFDNREVTVQRPRPQLEEPARPELEAPRKALSWWDRLTR